MDLENTDFEDNKKDDEVPVKSNEEERPKYPIPKWEMVRDVDDGDWDF